MCRQIAYTNGKTSYQSLPDGIELLKLAKSPIRVTISGYRVAAAQNRNAPPSWIYNPKSQVL